MILYNMQAEVSETHEQLKVMQDNILDLFHVNKSQATRLLNELNSLEKELEELDREIEQLMKEID